MVAPERSAFDEWQAALEAVAEILKQRFPNLTAQETLNLAAAIVKAVLKSLIGT